MNDRILEILPKVKLSANEGEGMHTREWVLQGGKDEQQPLHVKHLNARGTCKCEAECCAATHVNGQQRVNKLNNMKTAANSEQRTATTTVTTMSTTTPQHYCWQCCLENGARGPTCNAKWWHATRCDGVKCRVHENNCYRMWQVKGEKLRETWYQ